MAVEARVAASLLDKLLACPRIGRLGLNTLLSTAGLGVRALIQAGYLVLLSRWMGAEGYGLFAGSVAVAILLGPLCGWGVAYLLSDAVGRDMSALGALWATALVQIALTGTVLVALLLIASVVFLDMRLSIGAMLLLGMAELLALPVSNMAISASLAVGRGVAASCAMCVVPAGRLVFVSGFMLGGWRGEPDHVAAMHFAGSVAGALGAMGLVWHLGGRPAWRRRRSLGRTTRDGTRYALGSLVGNGYHEIDKVLMLQMLGATAVGTYTAAFRVIGVFVLPIAALMGVALPRLYALGTSHEGAGLRRAIAIATLGYAVVATVVAAALSPLLPVLLGPDFAASSRYMLMLVPWIIPFALHQYSAIALTTRGLQGARVAVDATGLLLVVLLNLWLLQVLGRGGAVVSLLVAEVLMAAGCWAVLAASNRRAAKA
nr:oligosaccharide flippase family protein [Luteimonas sp. MC1825]